VDTGRGGEIAKDQPERMAGADLVVPIGDEHEGSGVFDAATEEAQQIKRGFVCPMGILDSQHGGPMAAGELGQHGMKETVAGSVVGKEPA
jgi:hypothetical protein